MLFWIAGDMKRFIFSLFFYQNRFVICGISSEEAYGLQFPKCQTLDPHLISGFLLFSGEITQVYVKRRFRVMLLQFWRHWRRSVANSGLYNEFMMTFNSYFLSLVFKTSEFSITFLFTGKTHPNKWYPSAQLTVIAQIN